MSVEREYILEKLAKIEVLPTFPTLVGEVIHVIEDPMSSAADLARSLDPSMAGEILRVANTAYYGTRNFRNIGSIEHAIAIIGLEHISNIILHMPFLSMLKSDSEFDRDGYVIHSLVCAILSRAMSESMRMADANEVYIGGLMHDVGSIVLSRYFTEEWQKINELVRDKEMQRIEAEKEVLGVDHGYVGAVLLKLWNLPATITDGVMYHHDPEGAEDNKNYAVVINLGNKFAKIINLRDNFLSFDEFLTKYYSFVEDMRALGVLLSSGEELKFFERIFTQVKNAKGFFEEVILKEKHD